MLYCSVHNDRASLQYEIAYDDANHLNEQMSYCSLHNGRVFLHEQFLNDVVTDMIQ